MSIDTETTETTTPTTTPDPAAVVETDDLNDSAENDDTE